MKTFLLSLQLYFFIVVFGEAQVWMQNGTEYTNFVTRLSKATNINQTDVLNGAASKNAKVSGETYLNKTWNVSTLNFYNYTAPVDGHYIKYEVTGKQLEILINKSVKLIDCSRIRNFTWIDSVTQRPHYFVNGKELSFADTPLIGFLEVLSEGRISLFVKVEVEIVNANFNPLLATRGEDAAFTMKEFFFIQREKKVYGFKKKKDFLKILPEKEIADFIESNHLRVSKKDDLIEIVNYYNSLPQLPE